MNKRLREHVSVYLTFLVFFGTLFLSSCSTTVTHRGVTVDDVFIENSAKTLKFLEKSGVLLLDTITDAYLAKLVPREIAAKAIELKIKMYDTLRAAGSALSSYEDAGGSSDSVSSYIALLSSLVDEMTLLAKDIPK